MIVLVVKKLEAMRVSDPELASDLLNYIYATSMVNAGLQDDPVLVAQRSNGLLEKLLAKI